MRVKAVARRILIQIIHDRRTFALMILAPLLMLSLIYLLLDDSATQISIAVINAPEGYVDNLYENNVTTVRASESEARRLLDKGKVTASVNMKAGKLYIDIDGSNSVKTEAALKMMETAKQGITPSRPDLKSDINYIYGYEDITMFDNFGAAFVGILVFFFVFLISGISFLQERTTGTLEKILSTPIKRWEIVVGYTAGFGVITIIQSLIISLYIIYVLNVMMIGSFFWVLTITLLTAISALTLGMLLSTLANNEFQMVQFIPIVIVPQIFLSGIFDLSPLWLAIGHLTPIYYVTDALTEVMIRGGGLYEIWPDLILIVGFSLFFMALNTRILRKYRWI